MYATSRGRNFKSSIFAEVKVVEPHRDETTLSERLNRLWATVHPGQRPYTYEQVASGLADLGYDISVTYLWQLRKGEKSNPTLQHIQGLAQFFGVPAAYFLDSAEEARVNRQLELLLAMKNAHVRNIAMRAHGLEEADLVAIETMLTSLRAARGLPDPLPSQSGAKDA